jgi:hypothetical protein
MKLNEVCNDQILEIMTMIPRTIFIFFALTLMLVASGCQLQPSGNLALSASDAAQEEIYEVTFTAADLRFSGPDNITAGSAHVHLVNEGNDAHHIQIVKLSGANSLDDLLAALEESLVWPEWAPTYGGPNAVIPGESSNALVHLDPGNYVLLSWVPDAQGVPQFRHGMVKPLEVTGSHTEMKDLAADVTLDLLDFSFALSQPIQAGTQTIRIQNKGQQPHEVLLVELAPDASAMDFLNSLGSEAPKGKPIGGITEIEPEMHNTIITTFESGVRYGLICFVTDPETGQLHFMQGMIQDFLVE